MWVSCLPVCLCPVGAVPTEVRRGHQIPSPETRVKCSCELSRHVGAGSELRLPVSTANVNCCVNCMPLIPDAGGRGRQISEFETSLVSE